MSHYSEICRFWFSNPQYWFDSSDEDDLLITLKYENLFDNFMNIDDSLFSQNGVSNVEDEVKDDKIKLSLILLFDQIGRHICRVRKSDHTPYFKYAFRIASSIIEDRDLLERYSPEERVFILLVYRHTFEIHFIEKAILLIQEWRVLENHPIYRRFYQASLNSLGKLKNQIPMLYEAVKDEYSHEEINAILDEKQSPKMADFFLFESKSSVYNEEIYKIFESHIIKYRQQIGVSLSGGVDSMVCAFLLYLFYQKHSYITPIAFSINYGNRVEQKIELFMVNQVLAHWYNTNYSQLDGDSFQGIKRSCHYVRTIDEIKRTQDHDREFYETYTRNVRFECYRQVSNEKSTTPFILGHNRDDSLENVISNIKKGRSCQNLFGMNDDGEEKGVTLLRPLLGVWKRDIIAFAQKYKIPFVYDSTPSWSERGQMRDVLFPFLNQFDPRILDGLFNIASNYKEIYKVYETLLPKIVFEESSCIIEDKEIYFEDYMKRIVYQIVQHYGLYSIRNKSIHHLIHTLQFDKSTHKITLSKQLSCIKSTYKYGNPYYTITFMISK